MTIKRNEKRHQVTLGAEFMGTRLRLDSERRSSVEWDRTGQTLGHFTWATTSYD